MFIADLHIHSKYSRATAKTCDLENLCLWAQKKGISTIATGDFTHPAWRDELKEKLVSLDDGLFSLRADLKRAVDERLPKLLRNDVRFILSVEISTIYKKGERTRKVHHVVFVPSFEAADRFSQSLEKIGNIRSDGRPILGLDSRDLLEIVLESDPGSYLIPAHIWTPWFSVLGSKSGFDSIEDCYGDLAEHIFAVETGLSSDPKMNWRVSSLDKYRLVSNSDAHSPQKLGRESCIFDTEVNYYSIRKALETGEGYVGTVEFFPEEGKYHLDGHRKCDVRFDPKQTRQNKGLCTVCGKPVTIGVMHRVEELADKDESSPPPSTAGKVKSLIPLIEILSEIFGVGAASKSVAKTYEGLVTNLGSELDILTNISVEDISRLSNSTLAEAITRLRQGRVIREAGYDGEYGIIKLFDAGELSGKNKEGFLFDMPSAPCHCEDPALISIRSERGGRSNLPKTKRSQRLPTQARDDGADLDPDQQRAAEHTHGALLIVAGPGSGKTRTLTHRIAHLITAEGVKPQNCLAITFTRRAEGEMSERLKKLLPDAWEHVPIHTFHSLGLSILREDGSAIGLSNNFRIADEAEREKGIKRTDENEDVLDFDDLIILAIKVLKSNASALNKYRKRFSWISIDEYQDIDENQYELIRLLAPDGANICAIGDPDQAIYGFRGAEVGFFNRFTSDYSDATVVNLVKNYRSIKSIVNASSQVISTLHDVDKKAEAMLSEPGRITIHESPTEAAEAEFVVSSIEKLLGGHTFFSIDSGRANDPAETDFSFSDFAVLYRTNAQAGALCEAFIRSGLPFQKRSHTRLASHDGVRLIMDELRNDPKGKSLPDRLKLWAKDPSRAEAAEIIAPLVKRCGDDPYRFLAELSLGEEIDTWHPNAERISLLTLHAAKGLEFKVVFIIGCEDGILPLTWGAKPCADIDEERRLFYVGMTRAKQKLFLSRANKRMVHGKIKKSSPSPFLKDIEKKLIEMHETALKKRVPGDKRNQMDLF